MYTWHVRVAAAAQAMDVVSFPDLMLAHIGSGKETSMAGRKCKGCPTTSQPHHMPHLIRRQALEHMAGVLSLVPSHNVGECDTICTSRTSEYSGVRVAEQLHSTVSYIWYSGITWSKVGGGGERERQCVVCMVQHIVMRVKMEPLIENKNIFL